MSERKRGRKPARQITKTERVEQLIGLGAFGTYSKKDIIKKWDVSRGYFNLIWVEAKRSLASKGKKGMALVSNAHTGYKISLTDDPTLFAESVAKWNKTKTSADRNFREQSTNLRNGSQSAILDKVDELIAAPERIKEMSAEELDQLIQTLSDSELNDLAEHLLDS